MLPPIPERPEAIATSTRLESNFKDANIKREIAEIINPKKPGIRVPILSDNFPAKGPDIAIIRGPGNMYIPVFEDDNQ